MLTKGDLNQIQLVVIEGVLPLIQASEQRIKDELRSEMNLRFKEVWRELKGISEKIDILADYTEKELTILKSKISLSKEV